MSVLPNAKTPVDRCEDKSLYTCSMLRKFNDVTALDGLADKLENATDTLLAKQAAYRAKVKALIVLRVNLKFADRFADQTIRLCLKRAEIADGKAGGRVSTTLFPNGSTPIIKPVGDTQIKEMRALEGRYAEAEDIYPAAADDGATIKSAREPYEAALEARVKGLESSAQARAARDLAKEEYLDVFAECVNRIRAAFPRDKQTQDLFFLKDKESPEIDDPTNSPDDPT